MKILFAIPRIKSLFGGRGLTNHPHIGVAYLSAFLQRNGIQVRIFDEGINHDHRHLQQLLGDFEPDMVGVTIFSYCYGYARSLIQSIRTFSPVPIVLGGAHVSTVRTAVLAETNADFAVKHEGEQTLLKLLQACGSGTKDFSSIAGLIWRRNAELIENPDRPFSCDLDALPFPDYELFGIKGYPCFVQKSLPLITSRGCPFGCNYCSVRLSMGQQFRPRSAQNVVDEMEFFSHRGWQSFDINDDCFTLDRQRALAICEGIISRRLPIRFQLYNGIRVDTVDPLLLRTLKEAGCFFISFGCETASPRLLARINKGITLEQVRSAVEGAVAAGIPNSVNFIIGHSDETYEEACATLRFAESLPTDFVNFYNLLPYPGTEAYTWVKQHAEFLVSPESYLEHISYRDNEPVFQTPGFTQRQRREIMARGFDLYKKRILSFRLGRRLGTIAYQLTRNRYADRLASHLALSNTIGKAIYSRLARKSFALPAAKHQ